MTHPCEWQLLPGKFALHCPEADEALRAGLLPLELAQPPRPAKPGCGPTLRVESDPRPGELLTLRESNWGYRGSDVQAGWDRSFTDGRRDNTLGVLGMTRLADGCFLFLREHDGRPLPAGGGSMEPADLRKGMTLAELAVRAGLRELDEETDGFLPGGPCQPRALAIVRYPQRGGRPDVVVEMRVAAVSRDLPRSMRDRERPRQGAFRVEVVPAERLVAFLKGWAPRVPVCGALYGLTQVGVLVP